MRRIKKWGKIVCFILFMLFILTQLISCAFELWVDKKFVNTRLINQFSVIGYSFTLLSTILISPSLFGLRNTYKIHGKCPKCNHMVEMKMEED